MTNNILKNTIHLSNINIDELTYLQVDNPNPHITQYCLINTQTGQPALFTFPELPTWGVAYNSVRKLHRLSLQFPTMVEAPFVISSYINGILAIVYKIKRDIYNNNWLGLKKQWCGCKYPYTRAEVLSRIHDAWNQQKITLTTPNIESSELNHTVNIYSSKGEHLFPDESLTVSGNAWLFNQLLCFKTKVTATTECYITCDDSNAYIDWRIRRAIIVVDSNIHSPIEMLFEKD